MVTDAGKRGEDARDAQTFTVRRRPSFERAIREDRDMNVTLRETEGIKGALPCTSQDNAD
jgi:hypothetical protein